MNIHLETQPNCLATLRVEIPPERVEQTWDSIAREYARHAKIPGYRPGKAPRAVVENKFKTEIREELTRKLLSESCREAIAEKKLNVLSLAEVKNVEIGQDKIMRFSATLVTAPEFQLPDYKEIPVKLEPANVTEQEVDEALTNLRDQHADFSDITDRPLQMDDFAVIDYTGTIEGKPVHEAVPGAGKPLSGNNDFWIKMTPEAFFPDFCEKLVGATPGEQRQIEIAVPDNFAVKDLGGKKIQFTVTLKTIKQKQLPELNDDLAAKIAEGKTLVDLRDMIRHELEHQKEHETERSTRNQIMDYLLSKVDCELPSGMVRQETRRLLADIVRENQLRGISEEALKESQQELINSASHSARERLKGTFILLRIAEAEKIEVTRQEFGQRVAALAHRYGMAPDKMRKEIEKRDAVHQIEEEVLVGKVLDFLTANAKSTLSQDA